MAGKPNNKSEADIRLFQLPDIHIGEQGNIEQGMKNLRQVFDRVAYEGTFRIYSEYGPWALAVRPSRLAKAINNRSKDGRAFHVTFTGLENYLLNSEYYLNSVLLKDHMIALTQRNFRIGAIIPIADFPGYNQASMLPTEKAYVCAVNERASADFPRAPDRRYDPWGLSKEEDNSKPSEAWDILGDFRSLSFTLDLGVKGRDIMHHKGSSFLPEMPEGANDPYAQKADEIIAHIESMAFD